MEASPVSLTELMEVQLEQLKRIDEVMASYAQMTEKPELINQLTQFQTSLAKVVDELEKAIELSKPSEETNS